MRFLLLLLCLVTFAPPAAAEGGRSCLRILAKVGEKKAEREAFWASTSPRTVGSEPFAFSFDAELWHATDMVRLASSTTAARAAGAEQVLRAGFGESADGMGKMIRLKPHETLLEFLHPESRDKAQLTLFDLTPEGLARVKDTQYMKEPYARLLLRPIDMALRERGIPVKAEWEPFSGSHQQGPLGDGSTVELKLNGAMTSPNEFRSLIQNFLHSEVRWPETHFHVSVPSGSVTPKQIMLAARAMEMKITLEELVAELTYEGTSHPHDNSALAKHLDDAEEGVDRGVVRVDIGRFDTPVPAHDVEFRMWLSPEHALENMRFFMMLITKRRQLLDSGGFRVQGLEDTAPANLPGSLRYAAFLLRKKGVTEERANIARQLNDYANEVAQAKTVTPEKRKEIAAYMKREKVLSHFTLDSFLK